MPAFKLSLLTIAAMAVLTAASLWPASAQPRVIPMVHTQSAGGAKEVGYRYRYRSGYRPYYLDDRAINFGSERIKNKKPFYLPLSDAALRLLTSIPKHEDRDLVFGRRKGAFQGWSKAKAELDAKLASIKPWQLRDIRRTVATSMAESGTEPHIVEACLNHVSGHKAGVAGIYNRAAYAEPKRDALNKWAKEIATILLPNRKRREV